MRNAHRALLVGIVLAAVPTACADNKTAKDTSKKLDDEIDAIALGVAALQHLAVENRLPPLAKKK